ncbi:MAG: hypothetical protein NDI61_03300 [Bdellovibrionaceae bacterium]|nr:hypothetical protein [Pseudobdellovibrionaceae bacterium]
MNIWLMVLFALVSGCATGNCRQIANAQVKAQQNPPAPAAPPPAPAAVASKGKTKQPPAPPREETVVIYKYDGSLQCGMGQAISVEAMEHELSGIPIRNREKKPDGMMHIQVCGQPTGMVNTYVIPLTRLAEAEKRGFRRWNFE